jgi:hypothetical protein
VNVRLLGKPLHREGHLLFIDELSDIHNVRVDIVTAVLFIEKAWGAGEPFGALWVFAEVFECLRWVFGTTDLMVQFLRLLYLWLALHLLVSFGGYIKLYLIEAN